MTLKCFFTEYLRSIFVKRYRVDLLYEILPLSCHQIAKYAWRFIAGQDVLEYFLALIRKITLKKVT